jgi:transcriptional regulator with XRE-family HTH domain
MLTGLSGKLTYMAGTIGERIRRIRKLMDMSTREFGRAMGVSHASVSLWENGDTKNLKNEHLLTMSKISGRRIEWIISGDTPEFLRPGLENREDLIKLLEKELMREGPHGELSKKIHKILKG